MASHKHGTELSALNDIAQLLADIYGVTGTEITLENIYNNVLSKIDRIKGSADYNRAITYHGTGTLNITSIIHTGTTLIGSETLTETITYVDPTINGSNITNVAYS